MLARPGLPGFKYVQAANAAEVHRFLQEGGARMMMGGTDLFPQMREGAVRPETIVDVKHVPGMRDLTYDERVGLSIGAAVTMNQLVKHSDVQAHYPILAQAAQSVASYQLRNRATIGGNVCNASPCADTSPAVMVLEGVMVLQGEGAERNVPAAGFFTGPSQTVIEPGEFLTAIRLPAPPAGGVGRYLKLGRSRVGDLSIVGVAVVGYRDPAAALGFCFRIALGSVAPIPLRAPAAEEILASNTPGEETFAAAAEKAMEVATPISDVRAGATYQKMMVRALTLRALREVWAELAPGRGA
jgi:carbon-monoxide dehydrogenase medium subunit